MAEPTGESCPSASHSSLPEDFLEAQAIRALFARSVAFREAVLTAPVLGPSGAVILEVHRGQQIAFRVVAPTPAEAYVLLQELITPLVNRPRMEARRATPPTMGEWRKTRV